MSRKLALLVSLLGALGCSSAPAQLLVSIDTDLVTDREPPVAGDAVLRSVRVTVCDGDCDRSEVPRVVRQWAVSRSGASGRVTLPFSFGVAPANPSMLGSVDIRVDALRRADDSVAPEDILFSARRQMTFERGTLRVPIFLAGACVGQVCPAGTTCDRGGECVPLGGPVDAGVSDAGADLDAALPDVGSDAGVDAGPACALIAERGVNAGAVTAVTIAADGSELSGGLGTSAFSWDGQASSVPAYFVSSAGARNWTTFITYDPARRGPWGNITQIVQHGDVIYVTGVAAEAWSIRGNGITLNMAESVVGRDTSMVSSQHHGVVMLALNAANGEPLWAHVMKRLGATEFVGGLAASDAGVWVVTRGFGGTLGAFELDRAPLSASVLRRGTASGLSYLAHFNPAGTLLSLQRFDGGVSDIDVAAVDDDVIVSLEGIFASMPLAGLSAAPPVGHEMVMARIDGSGVSRWTSSVDCIDGGWRLGSGSGSSALAIGGDEAFVGFAATTPSTTPATASCRALSIHADGMMNTVMRTPSSAWLGMLSFDVSTGAWADSFWSAAVNGSPLAVVAGMDADEMGVVATGFFGVGGANFGLGMTHAGQDRGTGSDGFVLALAHDLTPQFSMLLGSASAGSGLDDYGESVALSVGGIHVAVGMSDSQTFCDGARTVSGGGRLLRFGRPR